VFAAFVIATVPMFLLVGFTMRYFVSGLPEGALKLRSSRAEAVRLAARTAMLLSPASVHEPQDLLWREAIAGRPPGTRTDHALIRIHQHAVTVEQHGLRGHGPPRL
jgi:hypothetical protein